MSTKQSQTHLWRRHLENTQFNSHVIECDVIIVALVYRARTTVSQYQPPGQANRSAFRKKSLTTR